MFDIKTKTSDYMSIVLTHECTRACPFCIDKHRGNGKILSYDNYIQALIFAKGNHIRDILFTGGEPTLHPNVIEYVKIARDVGFRIIFTSNADKPEILYALDSIVDCFNFSHYNQKMPDPKKFHHADLTISKLLYKGGIDNKNKLDAFIDQYEKDFYLKFSTMTEINKWSKDNKTNFVNMLDGQEVLLFGEVPGLIYRGHIIKRYDCNSDATEASKQSWKCLANGEISPTWDE